jgi:hypothetical protein
MVVVTITGKVMGPESEPITTIVNDLLVKQSA